MLTQFTATASLWDISDSLQTQIGKLHHFGIQPVKKSVIANTNSKKPAQFYQVFVEETTYAVRILHRKKIPIQKQILLP